MRHSQQNVHSNYLGDYVNVVGLSHDGESELHQLKRVSEIHFQLNLAHVYLFTDRISEAKAIHKKYAHESLSNSKTWIAQTKSDFTTFEKHGLPTDDFKKILRVIE